MKGETYYEKDRRKSNELPQLRLLSVRVLFRYVLRVRILNRPKTAFSGTLIELSRFFIFVELEFMT